MRDPLFYPAVWLAVNVLVVGVLWRAHRGDRRRDAGQASPVEDELAARRALRPRSGNVDNVVALDDHRPGAAS